MTDESPIPADIEADFASLARLASTEAYDDVRMLLAKLVRKYRTKHPGLAKHLDASLKTSPGRAVGTAVLRKGISIDDATPGEILPVDGESRLALIRVFDDRGPFAEPLLPAKLRGQIDAVIQERRERSRLLERGISPTRSAILVGPPGVGKTLSARWIARSLNKPLWILDLTAVMSSLLGKTGNNLRIALDHAKRHAAVLLLDEIDAIAKRRSDESDIGELKRLVTVILQEVDQWPDTGLLLAATNHPELVDPALWRRFDVVLNFDAPNKASLEAAVRRFLGDELTAFEPWVDVLASSMRGSSLSDVERAINALRRGYALQSSPVHELVNNVVGDGKDNLSKAERLTLAIELARAGEHSHMSISQITGISRDTIRKHAGPSPRQGRGLK